MEDISAVHWEYVAEGRHHVIVRDKHSKPPYLVLRFKKRIETHAHEIALSAELGSEAPWVQRFLSPQYRPLRHCRKVAVSSAVIAAIDTRIHDDRPIGRRQDSLCVECRCALVEPDLSRLWHVREYAMQHQQRDASARGIVVEIKPKNNRVVHSPFYSGDSRLKHTMGRYSLLQHYKLIRASMGQAMPWGDFNHISDYEPHMMFSGKRADTQEALRALLENPQNNLRVSVDGQHVFGWDLANNKTTLCEHLVHTFRSHSCDEAFNILVDTLSSILHVEELLPQMLYMHSFDLFNVEGAAAVFEQLTEIAGSETQAFERVRQFNRFEDVDVDACLASLSQRLRCETWRQPQNEEEAQQMKSEAMCQLRSLTIDECVLALQLWLHALTISDCSVMIALQPHFNVHDGGPQCQTSSLEHPGTIMLQNSMDRTTCDVVHYTLGVVDVELKAFEKIVSKAVDDAAICSVVAAVINRR